MSTFALIMCLFFFPLAGAACAVIALELYYDARYRRRQFKECLNYTKTTEDSRRFHGEV